MAQRVILVDDFDGTDADETVTFGIDGKVFEIDLTSERAKELRKVLADYQSRARAVKKFPVKGSTATKVSSSATLSGDSMTYAEKQERKAYLSKVRKWGMAQGLPVNATGRVPQEIQDAYDAAH